MQIWTNADHFGTYVKWSEVLWLYVTPEVRYRSEFDFLLSQIRETYGKQFAVERVIEFFRAVDEEEAYGVFVWQRVILEYGVDPRKWCRDLRCGHARVEWIFTLHGSIAAA